MLEQMTDLRRSYGSMPATKGHKPSSQSTVQYGAQNDETVRSHYNSIKNDNRRASSLLGLRNFNNFVKWLLIFENSNPYEVVLDMACGKGGDLEKWRRAGVDGLIGIDIADVSIADAKKRYRETAKTLWADFIVGNCFGQDVSDLVHPDAFPVDCASCQFALHYAFDTEERIRQTLRNVSFALRPGGRFFGTCPNYEYLAENLQAGRTEWGNSKFKIKFEEPNPDGEFRSLAGNKYTFFLSEAVENVPEYVVRMDEFAKLALEYGLELTSQEPFLQFFEKRIKDSEGVYNEALSKRLIDRRGNLTLDAEQLEVCSIYLTFVFKKV